MSTKKHILDEFFSSVTSLGTPVFYILVILILLKFNIYFALKLFLALMFIELFCIAVKIIYRKERPVPQSRENFYNKIDANSFPSVHSARIALLVTMVSLSYKDAFFSVIGIAVALFVGYSRIRLKRHYFIDVLFGFLIGIATAIIALHI